MVNLMNKKRLIFFSVALFCGVIIGLIIAAKFNFEPGLKSATTSEVLNSSLLSTSNVPFEHAVINVADKVGKAVVSISSESVEHVQYGRKNISPFGSQNEDDPLKKFFDEFFGEMPDREYKHMGLGSGVIIDSNGYILTNEHVVRDADKLTVKLSDGRQFKAKVRGADPLSDLAVIEIQAKNLPIAILGDSDNLKIGQWVVAIGNPFGFALQNPEPTVTAGVVSALHRSLSRSLGRQKDYSDLIQTDAAINPGNSGGPLVNLDGEIIGINVAIFSTSGGYEGIGFAIPINNAKRIVSKLIKGEEVVYGWLGITIQNIDQKLADYLELASNQGVLVANVLKGSPAEKAGMQSSDVIVEFDSQAIKDTRDLLKIVGQAPVGKKVTVVVIREKKKQSLQVEIGQRPPEDKLVQNIAGSEEQKQAQKWRGLAVGDITEDLARRFKLEQNSGVIVSDVESGSAADEAGIVPGDIILELNKQEVNNVDDFNKIKDKVSADCLVRMNRGYFVISSK
jgi:serine protease Do